MFYIQSIHWSIRVSIAVSLYLVLAHKHLVVVQLNCTVVSRSMGAPLISQAQVLSRGCRSVDNELTPNGETVLVGEAGWL